MERLAEGLPLADRDGNPLDEIPRILQTYLFCSPKLDLELRCLPRAGGYYDQYLVDMIKFNLIEGRLKEILNRRKPEALPGARAPAMNTSSLARQVRVPYATKRPYSSRPH